MDKSKRELQKELNDITPQALWLNKMGLNETVHIIIKPLSMFSQAQWIFDVWMKSFDIR